MGKNWRGGRGGGRGGGGGGGGSLKGNGNGSILGTCDAGRERECSKELVNVFSQVIEWIEEENGHDDTDVYTANSVESKSFHDSLADEIAEMKQASRKSTQPVQSVDVVGEILFCKLYWSILVYVVIFSS
jgi:hypothetical protein